MRNHDGAGRGKALDLWQMPPEAGEPLACIATTFTFDATFFETECLGRFLQMSTHPLEGDDVGYLIEREEKLAAARVAVLVDRRHATSKESLRWDVLSVHVPVAFQHAKLSLLWWSECIRVIIGSGNLTEPGYRKNVEVFGTLEAWRDDGGDVEQLRQAVTFLGEVLDRVLGNENQPGPKRRTREILTSLQDQLSTWSQVNSASGAKTVFGGVGSSVLGQLGEMWGGKAARDACILSPFFDSSPEDTALPTLLDLLAQRGKRSLWFSVACEDHPDGSRFVSMPRSLVEAAAARCDVHVIPVSPTQDGEHRPLHAKVLVLGNEDRELWLIGSSNFTRAGCAAAGSQANLEANLVYQSRVGSSSNGALEDLWPEVGKALDPDDESIIWNAPAPAGPETAEPAAVIPAAFREALYDAREEQLILSLGKALPVQWSIRHPQNVELLNSKTWSGAAEKHVISLRGSPVPFLLSVTWDSGSATFTAAWPVNVLEPASLPPPGILRDLKLEELLAILGSTRPLHEAVAHVLRKRQRTMSADIALDPHSRVSTETFLLQRSKRVALALECMRQRLERPVVSEAALEWRLSGPVGPGALAEATRREARTPEEAVFFLAELALMLKRVRISEVPGGVDGAVIRARLRQCIEELRGMVAALGLPDSCAVAQYTRAAFAEAVR